MLMIALEARIVQRIPMEVLDGCLGLVDIGGLVTARRHGNMGKCELRIIVRGE